MIIPQRVQRTSSDKYHHEYRGQRNNVTILVASLIAYIGGFSHGIMSTMPRSCECNVNVSPNHHSGDDKSEPLVTVKASAPTNWVQKAMGGFLDDDDHKKGFIKPFERTPVKEYLPNHTTDTYTFFHNYIKLFGQDSPGHPENFKNFPLLHIWPNFFEAYHNHWQRYRGRKKVVFMEIGVQSGGKIGMLREYFGPGLVYIGLDINPSCKMFESPENNVHIEVGDSGDRAFLEGVKRKYPDAVDIFLDDGGHSMQQQRLAMEVMYPHVADDGVYACEDLNTSWNSQSRYGGKKMVDARDEYFREKTMLGLIHRSLDWLHYGWISGRLGQMEPAETFDDFWPNEPWWKQVATTVRHIHMYNQIVVYEKGPVEIFTTKTIGYQLPIRESGEHRKVDWHNISTLISNYTGSHYQW